MSILSSIIGGATLGPFGALIGPLVKIGASIIDKIPDANLRDKLKAEYDMAVLNSQTELEVAATEIAKAQLEVNAKEAEHESLFVAGWRPYIGWVGGFGMTYQFIVQPFIAWVSVNVGLNAPPSLDINTLMTLLFGMLGLGAYRTYEKQKGVSRSSIGR